MERAETIIQDDCSRLGLRVVHVMRMDQPVAVERWMEKVPMEALETARTLRRHERGLNVHHLYLTWKARELVRLQVAKRPPVDVVVWWIGKGADGKPVGLRQAAAQAACVYEMTCGCWPDTAWVRTLPAGATDSFAIYDGQRLALRQVDWGLTGFVIVGRDS